MGTIKLNTDVTVSPTEIADNDKTDWSALISVNQTSFKDLIEPNPKITGEINIEGDTVIITVDEPLYDGIANVGSIRKEINFSKRAIRELFEKLYTD